MARAQTRSDERRQSQSGEQLPARVEQFKAALLSPERQNELTRILPTHVRPDRFERNLSYALLQNPKLLTMEMVLVFQEVAKLTALGFLLDPQLGEAYVITAWSGTMGREVPQARIGYRGLIKLAKQSGEIEMIYASEVKQHDVFEEFRGDNKRLIHKPDTFGDRGPVIGYYAHVTFKSGTSDFETMTLPEIHAIRDRSEGWKAFKDNKIRSTPWATDEGEMAKKTAIRRLTKRLPQSPDLAEAIRIEDQAEFSGMRDVTPRARIVAPSASEQQRAALTHQPQESVAQDIRDEPERETVQADGRSDNGAPAEERRQQPAQQQKAAAPKTEAKPKPATWDPDRWLSEVRDLYGNAKTEQDVSGIWPQHVAPHADDVLPSDIDEIGGWRDEAMRRVRNA